MAELIAIGYPDETTAVLAADEAERLADDLIIQPDAIAAVVRRPNGKFEVKTNHHPVAAGASWGMFWGLLFGLLFFVPIFGMAFGAGLGALMGKIEQSGVDKEFQQQVRDLLEPGTSALFLMVVRVTLDKVLDALRPLNPEVMQTSLTAEQEQKLRDAFGAQAAGQPEAAVAAAG